MRLVPKFRRRPIAGIAPAAPGYQRVVFRPRPGGSLTWASARYRSDYGDIASRWSVSHGRFSLAVSVPVGTTAEVWVPARDVGQVATMARVDQSPGRGEKEWMT